MLAISIFQMQLLGQENTPATSNTGTVTMHWLLATLQLSDSASTPMVRAIEGASNYGTSGQILTSNGNDAPSWQDAGSVAVGGASAISMNDNVKINFWQ